MNEGYGTGGRERKRKGREFERGREVVYRKLKGTRTSEGGCCGS